MLLAFFCFLFCCNLCLSSRNESLYLKKRNKAKATPFTLPLPCLSSNSKFNLLAVKKTIISFHQILRMKLCTYSPLWKIRILGAKSEKPTQILCFINSNPSNVLEMQRECMLCGKQCTLSLQICSWRGQLMSSPDRIRSLLSQKHRKLPHSNM